jgi:hypothetical protein
MTDSWWRGPSPKLKELQTRHEGRTAFANGVHVHRCPYASNTVEAQQWRDGWFAAAQTYRNQILT